MGRKEAQKSTKDFSQGNSVTPMPLFQVSFKFLCLLCLLCLLVITDFEDLKDG